MKCPYCFKTYSIRYQVKKGSRIVRYCVYCKSEIPKSFFEFTDLDYTKIAIVGYPGHGKTTLAISFLFLLKQLNCYWKGFYIETLDDSSHAALHYGVNELAQNKPLHPTEPVFPKPTFFCLNNIPHYHKEFVGIFDTGGKMFENLDLMTRKGRYFAESNTIFFVISLAEIDMEDNWNLKIMKLLDRYINVVYSRYGVKTYKRQDVAFVFTKFDKLMKSGIDDKLPNVILDSFETINIENYKQINNVTFTRIKTNSNNIESWLRSSGCNSFINFAKNHFRNISFFLTSAIGAISEENIEKKLSLNDPKFILDPFLWALNNTLVNK